MTLDLERERVVQELCTAYANDHLSTGELEARLERAYGTEDRQQLLTLLHGLPAAPRPAHAAPVVVREARQAPATPGRGLPSDERRYMAIFSEVKKEGVWAPTRRIAARAIFGGVRLDLREATIPADGIDIDLEVLLGEAVILLPPGVGADVDCTTVMGTVEDKSRPAVSGAPTVRIRGGAVLASITVVTKVPKKDRVDSWRRQLRSWLGTDETA